MVGEMLIAALMTLTPMATDVDAEQIRDLDEVTSVRVTEYCPTCNSPSGHGSASGVFLAEGHCACGWLPMGSIVIIDGEEYEVVDVCGTDAIDIFVDDDSGVCHCDRNEYEEAVIIRP